jgi:hypothetical protein
MSEWVKSTYSGPNGECLEWRKSTHSVSGHCLEWRKSSYSSSGACVEVGGRVEVRDSKNPDGTVLQFGGVSWGRFIAQVRQDAIA